MTAYRAAPVVMMDPAVDVPMSAISVPSSMVNAYLAAKDELAEVDRRLADLEETHSLRHDEHQRMLATTEQTNEWETGGVFERYQELGRLYVALVQAERAVRAARSSRQRLQGNVTREYDRLQARVWKAIDGGEVVG